MSRIAHADFSMPAPAEPFARDSLPERIYRQVHELVANGKLDPATKLTETQLASMLGVSRTPLREALTRLRYEGLLSSGGGAAVAALTRKDLEDIMELRLLIEPYLARRAAELATEESVEALRVVVARERQAVGHGAAMLKDFIMANHEFRILLLELADNRKLAEAASRHDSQIHALRRVTLESKNNRGIVVKSHEALVRACADHDSDRAEQLQRELLWQARTAILAMTPTASG